MKFDIRESEITASTNDDARLAAEQGAGEGLVIWAHSQSAGRGRQGRQWHSPVGNLYCSVLLRPHCERRDYGLFSFVAALAIGDMVGAFLPAANIELKWPNDVLVGGKKISGILLESGEGWLVAGMGVNILHIPENPLYPVTSLAAEQADVTVENALHRLLQALAARYEVMQAQGFAPLRADWLTRARKGEMRVKQKTEGRGRGSDEGEIRGQFGDLDAQGNLRLILSDGSERVISSGDVFF